MMSKTANIKVIKRRNLSNQSTQPKTERRKKISKSQMERLLAISVLDWVREQRKRRRNEEINAIRSFFGNHNALPNVA